jgi:hypothetical protein
VFVFVFLFALNFFYFRPKYLCFWQYYLKMGVARFVVLCITQAMWIADSVSFQMPQAPVLRNHALCFSKCGISSRPLVKRGGLALNSKSLSASEQAELAEMQGLFLFI